MIAGIGAFFSSIGSGIASGASAVGSGIASGASAVGSGIASGAKAVGGALSNGASMLGKGASALGSALGGSQTGTKALSGIQMGVSGLGGIVQYQQNKINYKLLRTQNKMLGLQANQVIIDAQEQNNLLQEQFNEAIGNLKFMAVNSGIKSTSGSIEHNIEQSGKNLGEDQATIMKNAKNEATNLRYEQAINSKLNRANYKSNRMSIILSSAMGMMNPLQNLMKG